MSILKESLLVDIIEFAITNREEIFSMADYKKYSRISYFHFDSEKQLLKRCFWKLRDAKIIEEISSDYEQVDREEYYLRNRITGKISKFNRRKNTTIFYISDNIEFDMDKEYSNVDINTLARLIVSILIFPYIVLEDGELNRFNILNYVIESTF